MKKIVVGTLLGCSLLSTQALASENSMYVGLDVLKSNNTFTVEANGGSADVDSNSQAFKLKIGSASNNGWRMQGYVLRETYDDTLFDATHDTLTELGLDIIKGFEITPEFSPFVQVGFGYGWMDVDGYTDNSIKEFNLKAGAGVMYKVTPKFELLAGLDFQHKRWQDIKVGSVTVETTENSTKLYVGANYHF